MIVGVTFVTLPMRGKVAELKIQKESLSATLQGSQSELERLTALSEDVAQSESTRKSLTEAVPVGPNQDVWILELENLMKGQGFTLNSVTFSQTDDKDLGHVLGASVSATGAYEKVISLLQKVENSKRLSRVTSMNLQRTDQAAVVLTLSLEAYYQ